MVFLKSNGYMVERNTTAWESMWKSLAAKPINGDDFVCEDEVTGECWEYVGSEGTKHTFRHRRHPVSKQREIVVIESNDFSFIEKKEDSDLSKK